MGINQSILPSDVDKVPWVMVTYDPGTYYKNFKFYDKFEVYSNNPDHMSKLTVAPKEIGSVPVIYNLDTNDSRLDKTDTFQNEMTVKDLVENLFEPIKGENTTNSAAGLFHPNETVNNSPNDADKVKILFNWLTKQNLKNKTYQLSHDFDSLNYQLQKLQDKKNSYAAFFSLLCSYAKIPCVIIQGYVKGGRYEFDKSLNEDLIREWNAVLVDKKWWLVDCFWGCVNSKHNILPEPFYLFPDPKHLKFTHFPENSTWQLLNEPLTANQFLKQPILKHRFFDMKMEILSHKNAEIRCEHGEQEIAFQLKSNTYYKQHFLCAVSRRNENKEWEFINLPRDDVQLDFIQTRTSANDDALEEENLDTLFCDEEEDDINVNEITADDYDGDSEHRVREALTREGTQVWSVNTQKPKEAGKQHKPIEQSTDIYLYVKVRFPEQGVYKLEIIGRPQNNVDYDWVAIYYVKVLWVPDWIVFFPREPIEGWGPNEYLKKCGLEAISHPKGEIKCYIPKWLQIKFKLLPTAKTKNVQLCYKLKQTDVDDTIEDTESDDKEFKQQLDLEEFKPNKEEIINIKILIRSEGEYVTTISAKLNETNKGEVISYRIVAERDPKEIEDGLAMEAKLELESAINSNAIDKLKDALKKTNPYKGHRLVIGIYSSAAKLRRRLINYNNALKRIAHIDNRLILTIKGYPKPKQEVVSVMRAMFILLGEPSKHLQTWDDIRSLIKTIGENNFKRRLDILDKKAIPVEVVLHAKSALREENTIGALKQSEDVAAMVYWMESVFVLHNIDVTA